MPVRFRSVVPYTMPGVLVLIGWWWYTSRKKDRRIGQKISDVSPPPVSLRDSDVEGNNGLLYEGESPAFPNLSNQYENKMSSPIQHQDLEAISLLEQKCDHFCDRTILEEVNRPSNLIAPKFDNSDLVEKSKKSFKEPKSDSTPPPFAKLEEYPAKELDLVQDLVEEVTLPSKSSAIKIHVSDAERPEPEGEVATHSTVNAPEDIVCIFTSGKTHRPMTSDGDSLENSLSGQELHKHILTSTPTILSSNVQGTITSLVTSEDMHLKSNNQEMNDLELLAAGLITEVLSAATQEVLGTPSYEITPNNKPNNRSGALASGTRCSKQDLMRENSFADGISQGNHKPTKAAKKEVQGVAKGGLLTPEWENVETMILKTHSGPNAVWSMLPYQGNPVQLTKHKGDEAAMLAEDSACSTYHSEEGISSEDLQSSVLANPADVFKTTDLSEKEAIQPQSVVGSLSKEENCDAMCELKGVNGNSLRNGAHGTCELDTDQSGGET